MQRPETLLFKPQFHGLFVHEWVQRFVRNRINGEELSLNTEDVLSAVMQQDRVPTFDIHHALNGIKEENLVSWGEQLCGFLSGHGVHTVKTEHRIEKPYKGFLYVGVIDILAYTPGGCIVIDLKNSDKVKEYDGKQVTFYSWLLDGVNVTHAYLYFLKSRGATEHIEFELKRHEELLRWMLHKMEQIGHIIANELWEYLPPKPFSRTCHPNRCGVYHLCPYGALSYEHGDAVGAEELGGVPLEITITDVEEEQDQETKEEEV